MAVSETSELSIQIAILELMADKRVWTNGELKRRLAKTLPWTQADLAASGPRPNEATWENRVNNALSPSRASSLYAKAHVENVGRGEHRITQQGLRFISDDEPTLEELAGSV